MELCSPSAHSTSFLSPQASFQKDKAAISSLPAAKLPSADASTSRRPLASSLLPSSAVALFAGAPAFALSYDDLTLSVPSLQAPTDVDVGAIADSVSSFVAENPLAVIAGVAVLALPLVVSSLFSQGKPWSSISAKEAFKKLETENAELLDIRSGEDIKTEGTPDLRAVKKRVYQIAYTAGEDEAFLKKLLAKFKQPSETTLYILDQFDGNSLSVAKLITANGFKSAYAIKGGTEGPNGWRSNELPWILPRKGFTMDISGLKDVIDSTFSENPNLVPATLGVAAAAGVSLVVFSEAETALQILGSAALVQLFVKKFLFAKDRKKTIQELQMFLDTKIAPKELVDELKGIGGMLLPKYDEVAPVGVTNGAAATTESTQVQAEVAAVAEEVENKVEVPKETAPAPEMPEILAKESALETPAPLAKESTPETPLAKEMAPEMPLASVSSTDIPSSATPLSPYTQYPGLKPPSSPTPSRP